MVESCGIEPHRPPCAADFQSGGQRSSPLAAARCGKHNKKKSSRLTTTADGGDKRDRTADLLNAIQALSQLSYTPIFGCAVFADRSIILPRLVCNVKHFFGKCTNFFSFFVNCRYFVLLFFPPRSGFAHSAAFDRFWDNKNADVPALRLLSSFLPTAAPYKKAQELSFLCFAGASWLTRTADTLINSQVL